MSDDDDDDNDEDEDEDGALSSYLCCEVKMLLIWFLVFFLFVCLFVGWLAGWPSDWPPNLPPDWPPDASSAVSAAVHRAESVSANAAWVFVSLSESAAAARQIGPTEGQTAHSKSDAAQQAGPPLTPHGANLQ